ncbi:hypothetical protein PLICRDRAFT_173801 [Plicaturopsis crispa FD-325 SS-3]|nr:hypothetical protein PLICRDRAFT_173801 [Plicaturopsis crispa FD-325 SS-3]
MEFTHVSLHSPSKNSSSSAVDVVGLTTPSTAPASGPSSPSLDPSDSRNSVARKRLSWGRINIGQDPLDAFRLELPPKPKNFARTDNATSDRDEDPFYTPTDDRAMAGGMRDSTFGNAPIVNTRYPSVSSTYSTTQAGPSSVSLIPDGHRDDDEAHLTSNMASMAGTSTERWSNDPADPERTSGSTPRSKRRTIRYSLSPSPGSRLKNASRSLRRASLRVVNLAGVGLEQQIRLPDDDGDDGDMEYKGTFEDEDKSTVYDLKSSLPIRGRTLGFLGPTSRVRLWLFKFLVFPWTEPLILVLIMFNAVVLTIQASRSLTLATSDGTSSPSPVKGYFHSWEDYALFAIFIVFTLEACARICVSGFVLDPDVPTSALFTAPFEAYPETPSGAPVTPNTSLARQSSLTRGNTLRQRFRRVQDNFLRPFTLADPHLSSSRVGEAPLSSIDIPVIEKAAHKAQAVHQHLRDPSNPTFFSKALHSDRSADTLSLPFRLSVTHAHGKTHRHVPYLRQSWNRIDFIAVVSFWVTFVLAMAGVERGAHHIGVFRAMSVLRTARLLTITSGTTTIMRSLKTARPLLTSVAYFVLFAMVLFSIIGVQSFKGSLRRTCFLNPTLGEDSVQLPSQACGGFIDPQSLNETGYLTFDGQSTGSSTKGYICPLGQVCQETENPVDNVESFDTIYYAALQVVIVASANGWSPLMYSMIDAEFFVSCFFFIVCIVVLNFWLINLFVAVITNTFSAIRSDTKKSAFGAAPLGPVLDEQDEGWDVAKGRRVVKNEWLKSIYHSVRWIWVFLALASLVLQATRTVDISEMHADLLNWGELAITIAFDVEIVLRFALELPDWRSFFMHGNNWLDLVLAIGSSIIQIPVIFRSPVYPWLTIFQLARFYRVILEVPRMRPLLLAVFGNMYGLANMSLFLILVNFLAALVAVQLLRGDVGVDQTINFGQLFNAFLGVYQVFSSENWTDVLYAAASAEMALGQTVIVVIFVAGWMLFANFIVLQMFIAVINENFDVAEESKKGKQASDYWATHQPQQTRATWIRKLNPYRWVKANPVKVKVENLPANLVLPIQKALVQDYTMPRQDGRSNSLRSTTGRGPRHYSSKSLSLLQRLFVGETKSNDVPLATLRNPRRDSVGPSNPNDEETERHLELLANVQSEAAAAEDTNDAIYERRAQKADFIRDHPSYDKSLWIFSQKNPIRRLCQTLVQPANGERIFGRAHSPIAHPMFQLLLLLTVIGGIVVESIATPIYRRQYFMTHGLVRGAWFEMAEMAFNLTLLVEFLIKVIADGFVFTPNAYLRSIWNVLDLFILAGLLVNVTTTLIFIGGLSRITRSLKALRSLRLITLIDRMRNTFQSLIISGATRILDAAILAILYMIPYAVWGLNIFNGVMNECNDTNATGMADCNNEFVNTVYGDSFGFLTPRVWDNPSPSTTFSFDTFRSSLLILFEIVSLEGWIDVMSVATSITGAGQQPETNASQVNAIFFLIYNLMGGVVILTLFVSIIIGNFKSKTGTAFLTQPQREWIDLQKLIKRQRPSKRPRVRPTSAIRSWCFDRAVHKHGWWSRLMTLLFIVHIFALMTQTFTVQSIADSIRNDFFLVLTFVYVIDITVRFTGLGWRSFRANGWNMFDIAVGGGSFATTLIVRFGSPGFVVQQLQKLFLVSIAFKLVQRTNSLNTLFKTAMASLPVILSLLGLWLILFIFFATLFVEVFSMTKWNSAETRSQNYSTMGSALVMLAFMSTGEGWNQYMHDYALVYPRCTNSSAIDPDSDCGSIGWAFTLFIAWNLLSMYIFVNMFTGVVVENFSYVFQTTGGAKSITREEMRAFKKVWAQFANQKTGYLERSRFVPFFGKLSGVFEVRIYPVEAVIPNILAASRDAGGESGYAFKPATVAGIDLKRLNKTLDGIDYASIRRRRSIYCRLYHEASISHQHGRGISFTDMLMMLAHHKLIVDREALVLKDLVVRTETNKLVTDLVNLDRVRSLLRMITLRRRFLAHRDRVRMSNQDIPAIVVDSLPTTPPPLSTLDIASASRDSNYGSPSPSSPGTAWRSPDASFGMDLSSRGLQRARRTSDISMLSGDLGNRFSDVSPSREEDAHEVISSMQNSMWGEMMAEAEEEENR